MWVRACGCVCMCVCVCVCARVGQEKGMFACAQGVQRITFSAFSPSLSQEARVRKDSENKNSKQEKQNSLIVSLREKHWKIKNACQHRQSLFCQPSEPVRKQNLVSELSAKSDRAAIKKMRRLLWARAT